MEKHVSGQSEKRCLCHYMQHKKYCHVTTLTMWLKTMSEVKWQSLERVSLQMTSDLKCFKKSNYRIQQELKIDLLNFKVLLCTRDYHNVINDKIDDTSDNNKRIFAVKAKNKTTAEY